MTRAVLVLPIALMASALGCARGRAALPPQPLMAPAPAPAEAPEEPPRVSPTRASLNVKKVPADVSTVRASYSPPVEPSPAATAPEAPPALADAPPAASEPEPIAAPPQDPPPSAPAAHPPAAGPQPAPSAAANGSKAGGDPMSLRADPAAPPGKPVARAAAIVGDTIISQRELKFAVNQRTKGAPEQFAQLPDDQKYAMIRDTLDSLIDRTLIIQEARRAQFKKADQWRKFSEYIDKHWNEKELPALLRKEGVADEIALRRKMDARGESLDDVKESWKVEAMSRDLLMINLQHQVEHPGLHDLEKYYAAHRKDVAFRREARVKWREVVVSAETPQSLPAAKSKAEAIRLRLLAGEDIARVAKSTSAGATAAKGGIWETAPNGTASPALNAALATLPTGQISPVIEGIKGVHVIRVESRSPAGQASFVEVQREIAEKLFQERFASAVETYLKDLRRRTVISSSIFKEIDNTAAIAGDAPKTDAEMRRAATR